MKKSAVITNYVIRKVNPIFSFFIFHFFQGANLAFSSQLLRLKNVNNA